MQFTMPTGRTATAVMVLVIVVLAALFAYSYAESSGTISGLNETVTSQQNQLSAQMLQLASAQDKVTNLTRTASSLKTQVTTLQSQVNSDEAMVISLTEKDTQANATIGSLTSQISSLDSNITSLDTQITSLNNQITSVNAQLATEQNEVVQLRSTINLMDSALASSTAQPVYSDDNFTVGAGGQESLTLGSTAAGGFVLVGLKSSTSNSTMVTIKSGDSGSSLPTDLGAAGVTGFSLGANASYTISFYSMGNSGFSATVNIWYFHS